MTKDNHQQDMIDNELVQLYRRQATEQPSPELDAAILAKAAQRSAPVAEDPQKVVRPPASFWQRHRWPVSSAASVMLIAGLLLINGGEDADMVAPMLNSDAIAPAAVEPMAASPAAFSADSAAVPEAASAAQLRQKALKTEGSESVEQMLTQVEQLAAHQPTQALAVLQQLEQQFPQITEQSHPLHQRYQQLKTSL
ncbi:hypothetical protein [Shewanella waksmanii]|uniref:hypothetical protein n=1 Tax=Shewanella waksmanii TaxID=213783 RepID=UPI00048B5D03|nr:hypothetical protein [Shewanella waksmanii]